MGKRSFFDFAQILRVGYLWPKTVSSKGISLAAFGVPRTSMPLQSGLKITPYLASKMSVNAEHTNGIQTKRHHSNIYSPLYFPKIGRSLHRHFRERTWERLPEAIEFQSENSPISTSFPTSNAKPSFTFEAELGTGTCLQSSAICHSFSFSRFKEMNNFKFFTRAKFHKSKSAPNGQNGTVNSTCQLKSPFDRFSRCHINRLEYHSQQNEQLGTVMSNDNLFILLAPKVEQDFQSSNSQDHERLCHPSSTYNGLCVLFAERRSRRLISCPDGEPGKKRIQFRW